MAKVTIPDLSVLNVLETICQTLAKEGEELTATRLKRDHGISDKVFDEAAEYGCKAKILRCGAYNRYKLLKEYVIPEEGYYDILLKTVSDQWLDDSYTTSDFYIENTSRKDAKVVGPWVRPDLTIVSYKKFPWTIGYEFDVVTFEVKRPDAANVLAVFEALAHSVAATKAYVVFPMSLSEWEKTSPDQAERVRDECSRHGVGLILVDDILGISPKSLHVIKAARRQIDHEKASAFLDAVLTSDGKSRISKWK